MHAYRHFAHGKTFDSHDANSLSLPTQDACSIAVAHAIHNADDHFEENVLKPTSRGFTPLRVALSPSLEGLWWPVPPRQCCHLCNSSAMLAFHAKQHGTLLFGKA